VFCPACSAEYREGFTVCADCQVVLVPVLAELPPARHPDIELVTIFDSTNPALIGIAKTVLESAGIEFVAVGEEAVSVVFPGNPFVGHVQLRVDQERAEEASELLASVTEADEPLPL
jgi:hypothetical protein